MEGGRWKERRKKGKERKGKERSAETNEEEEVFVGACLFLVATAGDEVGVHYLLDRYVIGSVD